MNGQIGVGEEGGHCDERRALGPLGMPWHAGEDFGRLISPATTENGTKRLRNRLEMSSCEKLIYLSMYMMKKRNGSRYGMIKIC